MISRRLKIVLLPLYIYFIILLTSCIGGKNVSENNGKMVGFKGQLPESGAMTMDIDWIIDEAEGTRDTLLADTAWHILTVKVVRTDASTKPTPVKGLQAAIYPKPSPKDDHGQKIELEDINCKDAIFSKVGDRCYSYFRISYDNPKITDEDFEISAQITPVSFPVIPAVGFLNMVMRPSFKYGNYRPVNPLEKKYYQGSIVISNSLSYKILLMQNASLSSLNITNIAPIINPMFSLMHRTSTTDKDPYYGAQDECSLTANPNNKQVNVLTKLHDYCILVYKASDTSTRDIESDAIKVSTNADFFFPYNASKYLLTARYEHGVPIPSQTKDGANFMVASGRAHQQGTAMVMDQAGSLYSGSINPSPYLFRQLALDYTFSPGIVFNRADQMPIYSDGMINIAEDGRISSGTQILTDLSTTNPVTVGSVTSAVTMKEVENSDRIEACRDPQTSLEPAWASTHVVLNTNVNLARNGLIHLWTYNQSNGDCGNWIPQNFIADIPIEGYDANIYEVYTQECYTNWNNGGRVSVHSNGCNGNTCSLNVDVTAIRNSDDVCAETKTKTFTITYSRPKVYLQLSNLSNFNYNASGKQGVALGGQVLNAWLGSQGGVVAQNVKCDFNDSQKPLCDGIGTYSNGLSDTSMSYSTDLLAGDSLRKGIVDFTRSSEYNLADFTISAKN